MIKAPIKNNRGVVLILSLILMMVMAITVTTYIFLTNTNMKIANNHTNDRKALYYAEAGLSKAIWYLMNTAPDLSTNGSWRTTGYPAEPGPNPNDPKQEIFAQGFYNMWVEDLGGNIRITAQGQVNNATRTLQQEFGSVFSPPAAPSVIAESWREI